MDKQNLGESVAGKLLETTAQPLHEFSIFLDS
jgi:hypothetical protein